jgi:hypothetical protein
MMLRSEPELELQPKARNADVSKPRNLRMLNPSVEQAVEFHQWIRLSPRVHWLPFSHSAILTV